ncbi:MAG: hypothetical protein H8F28_08845 [Fibrella sp.]|nr:hypothetical protein [Armatimonadota bacterium]
MSYDLAICLYCKQPARTDTVRCADCGKPFPPLPMIRRSTGKTFWQGIQSWVLTTLMQMFLTACVLTAFLGFIFAMVCVVMNGAITDTEIKILVLSALAVGALIIVSCIERRKRPRFDDDFWRQL